MPEGTPERVRLCHETRCPRLVALALAALALGACTHGRPSARGASSPTIAGETCAKFDDPASAKAAFTRSNGPLTAVLEDASWIRLEADPGGAQKRYPDYFAGYTTILVTLATQDFVQPTKETYLLEDSAGARVTSKPETYRGDTIKYFGPKHVADFTLVFPHVLSKDVTWLRLTREGSGGGTVTWDLAR
jgi:hypothetical protein